MSLCVLSIVQSTLCGAIMPSPAVRPPRHSPVARLIQSAPLPGCWESAVRCCLEAVGLPLVRYHLLGAYWIIMSMTVFQQPSAEGLVSSAVTENWGLWKISINHYRFGAGQSESEPFGSGAEIQSGKTNQTSSPFLCP